MSEEGMVPASESTESEIKEMIEENRREIKKLERDQIAYKWNTPSPSYYRRLAQLKIDTNELLIILGHRSLWVHKLKCTYIEDHIETLQRKNQRIERHCIALTGEGPEL